MRARELEEECKRVKRQLDELRGKVERGELPLDARAALEQAAALVVGAVSTAKGRARRRAELRRDRAQHMVHEAAMGRLDERAGERAREAA